MSNLAPIPLHADPPCLSPAPRRPLRPLVVALARAAARELWADAASPAPAPSARAEPAP